MKKLIIPLLFIIGLSLRLVFPMNRVFDFDQEQIAVNAQRILSGKLTLIGPQTGPAQFFTGPLIYYVGAMWYGISGGHPVANTLIAVSIYWFSFVILWQVLKRLFGSIPTAIFLSIYSFSPYFVSLDRTTWNPNLSFLSASLVLAGLLFPVKKISYLAGFLGMWLAYQAHFSGFILILGVVGLGVWRKRWRYLLASLSGLIISILPTIVFDLRHNYLNVKGLLAMLVNPEQVSGGVSIHSRFFNSFLISLENLTKIVIPDLAHWSLVGLGLLILWLWWVKKPIFFNKTERLILLVWILIFPVVLMYYRGSTPEYYFLMQLPAYVFILAELISVSFKRNYSAFWLAALGIISLGLVIENNQALASGPSLANKLKAIKFIKDKEKDHPGNIVFDMNVGDKFGWSYLLNYSNLDLAENSFPVHLIYPVNSKTVSSAKFGSIGVWFDRRQEIDAELFTDDDGPILFYYPRGYWPIIQAERYLYPGDAQIRVIMFSPQQKSGEAAIKQSIFYIYLPKNEINDYLVPLDETLYQYFMNKWIKTNFWKGELMDRKTLMLSRGEKVLVFSFPQTYSWEEVELFMSRVEGV